MDSKQYAKDAIRTLSEISSENFTEEELTKLLNNIHMSLGMVTEAGELADVFKKNLAYGKEIDWVNVKEEIGDCMWYIINFCTINGLNLDEIIQNNIDKLSTRYPEKFTEDAAINRDLPKERKVLEGVGRELEIIKELGYEDS